MNQIAPVATAHPGTPRESLPVAPAPALISIVINNYNYADFLADAIDSALNQRYSHTEVIVVDDGSTDQSRAIIERYRDRIIPVFKENGGQSSAFSAGLQQSHGEIVMFLDADDMLLPGIADDVAAAYAANPGLSKIQFRLEIVDTNGIPTGRYTPPKKIPMLSGDLRRQALRFPDDICSPPTSGNAFARSMLTQVLPVPETPQGQTGADLYLINLAPLFGSIVSLPDVGGQYRVHGENLDYSTHLNIDRVRRTIYRTSLNRLFLVRHAQRLGLLPATSTGSEILSVTYLASRIASLRIDPARHPLEEDTRVRLAWLGIRESWRRYDLPFHMRVRFMLWFVAAAAGPVQLTRWLFELALFPEQGNSLNRLVHRLAR